jgi:hypothetical protein
VYAIFVPHGDQAVSLKPPKGRMGASYGVPSNKFLPSLIFLL